MPVTHPAKRFAQRAAPLARGPEIAFAATLVIACAAMAAGTQVLPSDFVLPVVSTLFFILACLVTLVGSCGARAAEQDQLTYWDVAGALTLFGICVASQVEPDQMVRLIEGTHREH
jgi:hypothetical protein